MKQILTLLILFSMLTSCNEAEKKLSAQIHFTINQYLLPTDTTITYIAYFKDNIICLQDDGKFAILDSDYNRNRLLEDKLNSCKPNNMFTFHDTVFLDTKNAAYFIDCNFKLQEFKREENRYGSYLYEDSVFYVYGCCAGEFGGAVFFLNKITNRTYSYFATCATQVLKFKNQYVVCNNLAHLGCTMNFLLVPDPTKLYELADEKLKNHCNWYMEVDSLKNRKEKNAIGNISFYRRIFGSMSLSSFPRGDSLYSIICNDSTTYLAVHNGDTTFERQRIFNKAIQFHQTQVVKAGNKYICLYNLTNGSPVEAYAIKGNNSGLFVINDNKIDILDK